MKNQEHDDRQRQQVEDARARAANHRPPQPGDRLLRPDIALLLEEQERKARTVRVINKYDRDR